MMACLLDSLLDWSDSVWCGIDAGVRDDATALLVLGSRGDGDTEELRVWSHQWLHRDGYDKRKNQAPYDDFIEAGELTTCTRDGQDLAEMLGLIEDKINNSGTLAAIGVDQHKLIDTITQLEDMGITVLAIPQGWQISKYIIKTDRLVHEGRLRQFGEPMLRFNVENGQLQERGRGLVMTKPGDVGVSKHKIDGLVCLVMAIAAMTEEPATEANLLFV